MGFKVLGLSGRFLRGVVVTILGCPRVLVV